MRSRFNSVPDYKHLSYPSHTISLLLQVFLLVSACLFACSTCNEANTHALTDCFSTQYWTAPLFCIFPVQIPWQVHTGLEKRDSGFVCVLHYGAYAGVRWRGCGPAHIGEEPNLSWVRAEEPKKTLDLQNKTLSMEMDIFTCMAPRRTTAEWLFNGKQGDCVRPARESSWETSNMRTSKDSRIRGAELTPKWGPVYKQTPLSCWKCCLSLILAVMFCLMLRYNSKNQC